MGSNPVQAWISLRALISYIAAQAVCITVMINRASMYFTVVQIYDLKTSKSKPFDDMLDYNIIFSSD